MISPSEGVRMTGQSLVKLCREGKFDSGTAKTYIDEKPTHDTIKALRR